MTVPRINRAGLHAANHIPHPIHIQSDLRYIRRPVTVQNHRHMMPLAVIDRFCAINPAIINFGPDRPAGKNPNHPFVTRPQRTPGHNLPARFGGLNPRRTRPR